MVWADYLDGVESRLLMGLIAASRGRRIFSLQKVPKPPLCAPADPALIFHLIELLSTRCYGKSALKTA